MLVGDLKNIVKRTVKNVLVWFEIKKGFVLKIFGYGEKSLQLVVCGCPRSGTSLFYNMLSATLQDFYLEEWEVSATESIWRLGNRASKAPVDLLRREEILKKNVHSKKVIFIVLIRDVRDVITSRHQFSPDCFVMGFEGSYTFSGVYPRYSKKFDGPGVGRYFREVEEIIRDDRYVVFLVKYENLVKDPDKVQAMLGENYGLRFSGKFSDYHENKSKHKLKYEGDRSALDESLVKSSSAVSNQFVARWKDPCYTNRVREQFGTYPELFRILRAYQYESSDHWIDTLKG